MFCKQCGIELKEGASFCSECGAAAASGTTGAANVQLLNGEPQDTNAPYNLMCILGVVISGVSLLINFAGIVGLVGLVLSIIGLLQVRTKNEKGKVLAIIGIVIGAFSVVYGCFSLLVLATML